MPSLRTYSLLLSALPVMVAAQVAISGRTLDARTSEPLAFVNVSVEGAREGTISDIDGRFTLDVVRLPVDLRFSYVGYAELKLRVAEVAPLVVELEQQSELLQEAVIMPGVNPAHRIIERVWANRKENDGMKHRAHRYRSYSKTIFTAALDSSKLNDTAWFAGLDSNSRGTVDFFQQQYLLVMESATRKSFDPPAREREEVLAMRVSGLKDPSLLALAASTKSFSMYDPQILLNEKTYVGPIGPRSTSHYFFLLEDTLYRGADTVFVISYRPRRATKFDGLKGLLYVNTGGYALQNVIAEPAGEDNSTSLKVQQLHERVDGKWFPRQLNTWILFNNLKVNEYGLIGIGRTYLRDIELDVDVAGSEVRGPELVADRMELTRDDAYWNALRTDSLDGKDLRTYHVIDSVGDAEHLDRKVKVLDALLSGRVPLGPIDFDLTRVVAYNGYEGFRLGGGLRTNAKLSRLFSVGGYGAYGFRDRNAKYGGELRVKPLPARSFELRGFYENDVIESGGVAFRGQQGLFLLDATRLLYLDRMDRIERWGGEASWRIGALRLWVGSDRQWRVNDIGYAYTTNEGEGLTRLHRDFHTGNVYASLRYARGERIARLADRQVATPGKWPVLYVNVQKAMPDLWQGEWEFLRVDAMLEKSFRVRMIGTTTLRAMGGAVESDAPYPWLFNMRGTHGAGFNITTPMAYETMRPNEFTGDRYAALFLRHSFGHLLFKKKHFDPIPILVANAGWAALDRPELHRSFEPRGMEKGFFETGLQVDQVLKSGFSGIGFGAFYRLGAYGFEDPVENLVVKLAVNFVL